MRAAIIVVSICMFLHAGSRWPFVRPSPIGRGSAEECDVCPSVRFSRADFSQHPANARVNFRKSGYFLNHGRGGDRQRGSERHRRDLIDERPGEAMPHARRERVEPAAMAWLDAEAKAGERETLVAQLMQPVFRLPEL